MKTIVCILLCFLYATSLWTQTTSSCDLDYPRQQVEAKLTEIGTLSEVRSDIAIVSTENKIFFAGGSSNSELSSRVDIYDITTHSWAIAELSVARYMITPIANGNKVYFAGGEIGDGTTPVDNVDIYDVVTDKWTTDHLSTSGNNIAATAVANKVLFAGGDSGFVGINREYRVDIFDQSSGIWTTASLSEVKRGFHVALTIGNKVYIAGGESWASTTAYSWFVSDKVDIYDNATNTWSTETMYENKMGHAGITLENKIFWAGGQSGIKPNFYSSVLVEIWDTVNSYSSIECLLNAKGFCNAVQLDGKILFFPKSNLNFDLFDVTNNKWYYAEAPINFPYPKIISANDTIYVVGNVNVNGNWVSKLYELSFSLPLSITKIEQEKLKVFPNPVIDVLHFTEMFKKITIFKMSGQKISEAHLTEKMDLSNLSSGLYFLKVQDQFGQTSISKFIKR